MALSQRLQIRQSQALVMTPQLMQAIKLLQLSNLDLVAYVEAELERNPLLDRSAEDGPVAAEADGAPSPDGPPADGETLERERRLSRTAAPSRSGSIPRQTTSFPTTPSRPGRAPPKVRPDIPNGPPSAPAAMTTANTISKRLFPPRPHWPIGCASNSRSPSPIRGGA